MSIFTHLRFGDLGAPLFAFWLAALITGGMGQRELPAHVGGVPREAVNTTVMLQGKTAGAIAFGEAVVTVVNAKGEWRSTPVDTRGGFRLEANDAAPYLLWVRDAAGETWYSYAAGPGVANITPLTTLALLDANEGKPLDSLASVWPQQALDPARVAHASRKVRAHLSPLLKGQAGDARSYDVFTAESNAEQRSIGMLLNDVRVATHCAATRCAPVIQAPDGKLMPWNSDIVTPDLMFASAAR